MTICLLHYAVFDYVQKGIWKFLNCILQTDLHILQSLSLHAPCIGNYVALGINLSSGSPNNIIWNIDHSLPVTDAFCCFLDQFSVTPVSSECLLFTIRPLVSPSEYKNRELVHANEKCLKLMLQSNSRNTMSANFRITFHAHLCGIAKKT